MPSGWATGAGVIACADVATAIAKPEIAINLIIVRLPCCTDISVDSGAPINTALADKVPLVRLDRARLGAARPQRSRKGEHPMRAFHRVQSTAAVTLCTA